MSNEYPPPGSGNEPPHEPVQPDPATGPGTPPPPPPPVYGQPPAYPPPGAGAPVPGGFGPAKTSPLAIVSLVLGIVGFCCGQLFVLSIAAIVTGVMARKQVKEGMGRFKGDGLALAGLILGFAGILIGVVYWVLVATGTLSANFSVSG